MGERGARFISSPFVSHRRDLLLLSRRAQTRGKKKGRFGWPPLLRRSRLVCAAGPLITKNPVAPDASCKDSRVSLPWTVLVNVATLSSFAIQVGPFMLFNSRKYKAPPFTNSIPFRVISSRLEFMLTPPTPVCAVLGESQPRDHECNNLPAP